MLKFLGQPSLASLIFSPLRKLVASTVGFKLTAYGSFLMIFGFEMLMIVIGYALAILCIAVIAIGPIVIEWVIPIATIFGISAETLTTLFASVNVQWTPEVSLPFYKVYYNYIMGYHNGLNPLYWISYPVSWTVYMISNIASFYNTTYTFIGQVVYSIIGATGITFLLNVWWIINDISAQVQSQIESLVGLGGLAGWMHKPIAWLVASIVGVSQHVYTNLLTVQDWSTFWVLVKGIGQGLGIQAIYLISLPWWCLNHFLLEYVTTVLSQILIYPAVVWNMISDHALQGALHINHIEWQTILTNTLRKAPNLFQVGLNLIDEFIRNNTR
jgi:hypothetical protein